MSSSLRPTGWVFTRRVFPFPAATKQEGGGKTERGAVKQKQQQQQQQQVEGGGGGGVSSVMCVGSLDRRVFSQLVRRPGPRPLLLLLPLSCSPSTSSGPHSPLLPAPAPGEFPEKQDNQRETEPGRGGVGDGPAFLSGCQGWSHFTASGSSVCLSVCLTDCLTGCLPARHLEDFFYRRGSSLQLRVKRWSVCC